MKLSFSTRGWPGLSVEEMLDVALEMGFSGVEVYNLPCHDSLIERGGPFHKYNTAATARTLREKQLSIPCFDTSLDISSDKGAASVAAELAFVDAHREEAGKIVKMMEQGEIPERITHNDTKCNNIMIDLKTGEPLAVIDLDTVMPGSSLYDYGDAVRYGACTAAEDETDLSKITMDMELFKLSPTLRCSAHSPKGYHLLRCALPSRLSLNDKP